MQTNLIVLPLAIGLLGGLILLGLGYYQARRTVTKAKNDTKRLLREARQEAASKEQELLVTAREKLLAVEEIRIINNSRAIVSHRAT